MLFSKSVAGVFFLIAVISEIWAIPHPSITRERHVIHAPIKVRIIHHYKVQKVPIIIRKHLHYYKPQEEIHHHSQPVLEESHDNQISHDHDHQFEHHEEENRAKFKASFPHPDQDDQEEDYEESEQSQEEEYEDYEYE